MSKPSVDRNPKSESARAQDVERFIRLMPELLKAARLHRDFRKLKEIHKEKSSRGRY